MMVESDKIESIAQAISQQASLLRRAGRASQADGMEKRAAELRALLATGHTGRAPGFALHAA